MHASGNEFEEVIAEARKFMSMGERAPALRRAHYRSLSSPHDRSFHHNHAMKLRPRPTGIRTIRMQCATKSSEGGADYGANKAYSNKLEDKVTESANRCRSRPLNLKISRTV